MPRVVLPDYDIFSISAEGTLWGWDPFDNNTNLNLTLSKQKKYLKLTKKGAFNELCEGEAYLKYNSDREGSQVLKVNKYTGSTTFEEGNNCMSFSCDPGPAYYDCDKIKLLGVTEGECAPPEKTNCSENQIEVICDEYGSCGDCINLDDQEGIDCVQESIVFKKDSGAQSIGGKIPYGCGGDKYCYKKIKITLSDDYTLEDLGNDLKGKINSKLDGGKPIWGHGFNLIFGEDGSSELLYGGVGGLAGLSYSVGMDGPKVSVTCSKIKFYKKGKYKLKFVPKTSENEYGTPEYKSIDASEGMEMSVSCSREGHYELITCNSNSTSLGLNVTGFLINTTGKFKSKTIKPDKEKLLWQNFFLGSDCVKYITLNRVTNTKASGYYNKKTEASGYWNGGTASSFDNKTFYCDISYTYSFTWDKLGNFKEEGVYGGSSGETDTYNTSNAANQGGFSNGQTVLFGYYLPDGQVSGTSSGSNTWSDSEGDEVQTETWNREYNALPFTGNLIQGSGFVKYINFENCNKTVSFKCPYEDTETKDYLFCGTYTKTISQNKEYDITYNYNFDPKNTGYYYTVTWGSNSFVDINESHEKCNDFTSAFSKEDDDYSGFSSESVYLSNPLDKIELDDEDSDIEEYEIEDNYSSYKYNNWDGKGSVKEQKINSTTYKGSFYTNEALKGLSVEVVVGYVAITVESDSKNLPRKTTITKKQDDRKTVKCGVEVNDFNGSFSFPNYEGDWGYTTIYPYIYVDYSTLKPS